MKKIFLFVCTALLSYSIFAQSVFMQNGICSKSRLTGYNTAYDPGLSSGHSYDAIKYKIYLDLYNCFITPFPKSYTGNIILIFKADSSLNTIKLHANNTALTIDSVKYCGSGFMHSGNILYINLYRRINPGQTDSVKIYFRRNNITDFSFYNYSGRIYTFLQPEGARMLFPCWDRLNDKAKFEFRSKVPLNVKIGSNGLLKDSLLSGDTAYYRWVTGDQMAVYLFTINAQVNYRYDLSYYSKLSNPNDSIPVMLFYNPINPPTAAFKQSLRSITDYFSQIFTDYPFEKIGFANSYPDGNVHMEHQTLTLMNSAWTAGGIIPHEHGHQWFGDYITCKTLADFWLNEGFATYLEALWGEYSIGQNNYYYQVNAFNHNYQQGNAVMSFPIYNESWIEHTPPYDSLFNYAIIYAKSACVIHTLRKTIGDTLFFRTLKSFMNDTNFAYKSATTSDFKLKVNFITGSDYTWFFDQWLKQPNHPKYVNTMNIADSGAGGWKLYFTINQVQTNSGFYRMPVKLKINYSNNTDSFAVVNNTFNNQTFIFTSARRPVGIIFDYDTSILPKEANSVIGINNTNENIPLKFALAQNYPNPFNAGTIIKYSLPSETNVRLIIYDLTGKQVSVPINLKQAAGEYSYSLDAARLASGIYFYKLEAGVNSLIKKMIIVK